MSNYPNAAAEAGDKYLAMLEQGQDQFVEFVRSTRELIPKLPQGYHAAMPNMPSMPTMPSAKEMADAQYSFASKLLKQQEDFIRQLYKLPGSDSSTKRSTSAASTSSASKGRTAARKTTRKSKS